MYMTARERVLMALAHKDPDCVPFDLGGDFKCGDSSRCVQKVS